MVQAMRSLLATAAIVGSALGQTQVCPPRSCYARVTAAPGTIVVDASNTTAGSYVTFSQGAAALNTTTTDTQTIFIMPGLYHEQVYIPQLKGNLLIQGSTCDRRTYEGNQATVQFNMNLGNTTSDDLTATLRMWTTNVKVYNLNVVNNFGHISTNGQNLAISAYRTNQGYYACQFIGYQDTILTETGTQLYAGCLIVGAVDFIFGQTSLSWFDGCTIQTINAGCVTASGRDSATNPSWYVINNSSVNGTNGDPAGNNYLGRPWHDFARVVFQYTYLGNVIKPAGWSIWSTSTPNTENVTFAEYENYGPGSILDEGPRANFSEQLTAPITIESILGDDYATQWWVDTRYLTF